MEQLPLETKGKCWSTLLTTSSVAGICYLVMMFNESLYSWIADMFRWTPTSAGLLEQAESKIFSYLKKSHDLKYTTIPCKENPETELQIRTLSINKEANESTPLVLLHGFASGIGLWILNLDSLSQDRPLYALDILGFGRSSRPTFSKDPAEAENQLVESIEEWRQQMGLEKFILLGHSMGGFLAASYAIKHPDKVQHLILADPWGFPEHDMENRIIEIPLWAKMISAVLQPFNPLAGLRIAGPWGPQLIQRLRPDLLRKFEAVVDETADVSSYIYHCNAQPPSGEAAFKAMTARFGWAKLPMISRISSLRHDVPITFIFGSRSWIDSKSGLIVKQLRNNSSVEIKQIEGAGHHVYGDKPDEFNTLVRNICQDSDLTLSPSLSKTSQKQSPEEVKRSTEAVTSTKSRNDLSDMSVIL